MFRLLKKLMTVLLAITIIISTFGVYQAKAATSDQTLLNTYGTKFGRVGTCVSLNQLQNSATLSVIKQRYNSITLENEMKPDALLGYSPTLLSVSDAKALGYYIPSNYTETTVPKIDFTTIDKVLQICYNNGLGLRGHTLVWHGQTPDWLFKASYNSSSSYVSSTVMDARMEFYIKTVMGHVFSSNYGSVVYAWDIVNEYLHSPSTSGWNQIYGSVTDYPQFVKNAFRYAYETTSYFGLTNKVSLFYNDYNEYMESSDIITMINYINSGTHYCNGIGCQSHLSSSFPSASYYKSALQAFMNAGLQIQITELDAGANSDTEQATYLYDIMKAICEVKSAGANITGITWWGLSDDVSWRTDHPLLFSSLNTPKPSYYRTLDAYTNVFGTSNSSTTLSNGWYNIKNVNSQKYLQVASNTGANAQNVEIGTGSGASGQKWYVTNLGNGYFTLTSKLGSYALDVANGASTDGTNIQIHSSYSGTPQQFKLVAGSTSGQYGIVTAVSSGTKGLDVYGGGTSDGTNVCEWTYNSQSNQLWVFEPTN